MLCELGLVVIGGIKIGVVLGWFSCRLGTLVAIWGVVELDLASPPFILLLVTLLFWVFAVVEFFSVVVIFLASFMVLFSLVELETVLLVALRVADWLVETYFVLVADVEIGTHSFSELRLKFSLQNVQATPSTVIANCAQFTKPDWVNICKSDRGEVC